MRNYRLLILVAFLSGCYTQLEKPVALDPVDSSRPAAGEEGAGPGPGVPGGGVDPHENVDWMNEYDHDWQALAEMRNEIEALVGDGSCAGHGNCKVVGLGAKPCGGPWEWLVYSDFMMYEDEFLARVNEYNRYERALNTKWGKFSDCFYTAQPEVHCEFGRCVVKSRRH